MPGTMIGCVIRQHAARDRFFVSVPEWSNLALLTAQSSEIIVPSFIDLGLNGMHPLCFLPPPPPHTHLFLFCLKQEVDRVLGDDANKCREESVLLVERWNSGTQDYPDTARLHDMFRESAKRNPDATAVVFKVSYQSRFRINQGVVSIKVPYQSRCRIIQGVVSIMVWYQSRSRIHQGVMSIKVSFQSGSRINEGVIILSIKVS